MTTQLKINQEKLSSVIKELVDDIEPCCEAASAFIGVVTNDSGERIQVVLMAIAPGADEAFDEKLDEVADEYICVEEEPAQ